MEYLLTPKNLKVLESFSIVKTLYSFDYDGTLAAIQDDPDKALMSKKVSDLLQQLNSISSVAIITGRSLESMRKLLPFEPRFLIGNHGIEGVQTKSELETMKALCDNWKKSLNRLPADVWLEDKTYSLSIHYKDKRPELEKKLEKLPGASVMGGKNIYNIVPVYGFNKGQSLDRLMMINNFSFGFYIGDDTTDENVFAYTHSRLLTVRVGENPYSSAKYFIKSQEEIETLLEALVSFQNGKI